MEHDSLYTGIFFRVAMRKIQIIAFLTAVISGSTAAVEAPSTLNSAIWAQMSVSDANVQFSHLKTVPQSNGFIKIPRLWRTGDPNLSTPINSASTRELFFKMMVSVVLVVVLGAIAIYASKRLAGKIANLPGKKIKIVETAHLGPRKAVHLLRIGDRCLLIGSTNDNITKLADLTTEIVIQETLLAKESDLAKAHKTGPLTEFEFAPIPGDPGAPGAGLSTTYAENN